MNSCLNFNEMNAILLVMFSKDLPSYAKYPIPNELRFSFTEYVKSQLHFPFVSYFGERKLSEYKIVYDYVVKGVSDDTNINNIFQTIAKVVKYFYKDISSVVLSMSDIPDNFSFTTDFSSIDFAPRVQVTEEKFAQILSKDMLDKEIYFKRALVLKKFSVPNAPLTLVEF